jgi:Mg-chelatase subunit ChlD
MKTPQTARRKKKMTATPVKTKPRTYVAIILDKSGSMAATKAAAISGFNEQVQQLKEDSKDQEIYCSLVTFNGEVFEHLWNVPADKLAEASPEDYKPLGNTAMRDAMGYTVQKLLDTTDYEDENTAYLIVTISDGQSNSDKHYSPESWGELISSCEATKRWTFTYMGCTREYLMQIARQTGTSPSNMAAWSNTSLGATSRGFENAKFRQKKFFAERLAGQTASANYACDGLSVADYTAAAVEAAPAPVLADLAQAAKLDWPQLSNKLPKYVNCSSPSYHGGSPFGNTVQVKWSHEAQADINIMHGMCGLAAQALNTTPDKKA